MNDLKQIIANNITTLRKAKNLTQLEFAKELNYSDKAISKWERAESIPDVVVLKQIADFFGVTIDYLLNEHLENEKLIVIENKIKSSSLNKVSLSLLSACPIWIVSTIIFSLVSIFKGIYVWYVF